MTSKEQQADGQTACDADKQTNTQRWTECVRKASYGVETLWETKAQGQ